MRPFVIFSPRAAGPAGEEAFRGRLSRLLPAASVRATAAPGDARRLARAAVFEGFDPVVAAGGDGLAHEVLNGMADAGGSGDPVGAPSARLGLIPRGSGNDLARSLGVPRGLAEACEAIREGEERRLDALRVETDEPGPDGARTRLLANMAVASFAGRVARRVDPDTKRRFGGMAYRFAALRELLRLRPAETRVRVDGRRHAGPTYLVAVANGPFAGGGIRLVPGARPDDGVLDVLLVPDLPLPALAWAVVRLLAGRDPGASRALRFRGREVEVEIRPRLWLNVDGEDLPGARARFRVVPGAVVVLVPARRRRSDVG